MQFIKIETAVSDVWVNRDHIVSLNPQEAITGSDPADSLPYRLIVRLVNGDQFASLTQTVEEIITAFKAPDAPVARALTADGWTPITTWTQS